MGGVPLPDIPSERVESSSTPGDLNRRQTVQSTKREIVTITVTRADYSTLKAMDGPYPDEITKALQYYVDLVRETDWRPRGVSFGWSRGPVVHFLTAIPKVIADQVRSLPGRFDGHTIEAVRLYLGGEADILDAASQQPGFTSMRSDWVFAQLGALRFLVSRLFE